MAAVQARGGPDTHAILLPLTRVAAARHPRARSEGATLLRDGDRCGDFREPAFRARASTSTSISSGAASRRVGGAATVANLYQDFARGAVAFYITRPVEPRRVRAPAAGRARRRAGRRRRCPRPPARRPGRVARRRREPGDRPRLAATPTPRGELVEYLAEPAQQLRLHRRSTGDLPARRAAWQRRARSRPSRARRRSGRSSSTCARRRKIPSGSASRPDHAAAPRRRCAATRRSTRRSRRSTRRRPDPREAALAAGAAEAAFVTRRARALDGLGVRRARARR